MNGWHRICISSRRGDGNSLWVAVIKGNWIAGAWGGNIYRVPDKLADFCIAWLTDVPNTTRPIFSNSIQTQFGLEPVTNAEFDALIRVS